MESLSNPFSEKEKYQKAYMTKKANLRRQQEMNTLRREYYKVNVSAAKMSVKEKVCFLGCVIFFSTSLVICSILYLFPQLIYLDSYPL